MELFNKLKEVRKRIADEQISVASIRCSVRPLAASSGNRASHNDAFGNTFGIGEHKRDNYGTAFIEVIKEYATDQDNLPLPDAAMAPMTEAGESKEEKKRSSRIRLRYKAPSMRLTLTSGNR